MGEIKINELADWTFDLSFMSMSSKQGVSELQSITTDQKPHFGTIVREHRTAKGYSLRRFAGMPGESLIYFFHDEQSGSDCPRRPTILG